jgi:phosphatidylcholine synthase
MSAAGALSPSVAGMERALAWAVHAYTTSGAVLALLMVHFSYQGKEVTVLWLFLVAMVVDGSDGILSRRANVKTVLPQIDGALLDNIVDYLTYAFAPMVLLWACGYLPDGVWGGIVAATPLVASCYQFSRADAKTDDHFFLGFPSYWNVAAFYVVVLDLGVVTTTALLLVLVVLVFVPVKYVYPSRTEMLWTLNMVLAAVWLGLYGVITALLPDAPDLVVGLSLAYVVYYLVISLWLTLRRHADGRSAPVAP